LWGWSVVANTRKAFTEIENLQRYPRLSFPTTCLANGCRLGAGSKLTAHLQSSKSYLAKAALYQTITGSALIKPQLRLCRECAVRSWIYCLSWRWRTEAASPWSTRLT
jgi:hypothetical protein